MGKTLGQMTTPLNLFKVVSDAETGSFKNKYIRTTARPKDKKKSSTAFGPAQITGTTAQAYRDKGMLSPLTAQFYDSVMAPMYSNFRKYGTFQGQPPSTMAAFDYGGTGNFDPKYAPQYEQMAKEMLAEEWNRAGGNLQQFMANWRGVPASADPRYYNVLKQGLPAYAQ